MRARGLDGPGLLRDVFIWAYENLGYEGDDKHGTLLERTRQGARASGCGSQAPFASAP